MSGQSMVQPVDDRNAVSPGADATPPVRRAADTAVATSSERGTQADAKVMIVDDASMTVRLMKAFLEDAGYRRFVTTSRSSEAMALLVEERPDVLLLDLDMPEVSGFDVLEQLRAHPLVQHTPVLILTAAEDAGSKLRALELGATDFLAKPVDTSELALRL
ncbi:MAG: response regulator, partial [Pseudomonadota bacterium]